MHQKVHSDKRMYACHSGSCGKSFKRKIDLNRHMLIHRQAKPYSCTVCGKHFRQIAQLSQHVHVHSAIRLFQCKNCSLLFKTKQQRETHELVHAAEKPFKCPRCDLRCTQKANAVNHFLANHLLSGNSTKCAKCGNVFDNEGDCIIHLFLYHGAPDAESNSILSPRCVCFFLPGKRETSKSLFSSMFHHKENRLCTICANDVYNINPSNKSITCCHCSKSFENRLEFARHRLRIYSQREVERSSNYVQRNRKSTYVSLEPVTVLVRR